MIRACLVATLLAVAASNLVVAQSGPQRDDVGPTQPAVKKSRSGICHVMGDPWYAQTKHYEEFKSLEACLKSGGRLPKKKGL